MKHLKPLPNRITMPFIPLDISSNQVFVVGAKMQAGRTLYALHLIEENSLKRNNKKCLAYFVSNNKETVKQSGFSAMLTNSRNVKVNFIKYHNGDQLITDIVYDALDFTPSYIVIDGFEKFFNRSLLNTETELLNEVDMLLSHLQIISDDKKIPIILTTNILLSGESHVFHSRPLLCDFGTSVLEVTAHHVCSLRSPFYDGDTEKTQGEDTWGTMQIYQLLKDTSVKIPTDFTIDKEEGRFYSKTDN